MQILPFDNRDGVIWLNGKFVEWRHANVHVLNHGLHYASCVFEGLRIYNGKIFKLDEHTERLFKSAKILDLDIPYNYQEVVDISKQIILKQNISDGYLRPVVWRGSEMMAISAQKNKIHVAVATWEWGSYFDPKLKLNGIKLNISSWRRPAPNTIPWDTKAAGLYMICTLSKHEAEEKGFTDSLMLDHEGNIAEATGANVFFKNKLGELHTPVPDSFLDGITRREVIKIATIKGIKVVERKIRPEEMKDFEGCFLTGTAAEVTPVSQINDYKFKVCEVISSLNDSYQKLVRKDTAA